MSYHVLARKWRPKIFSDVVGQEHVMSALKNGLTLGRVHHAYLFSGTRGIGKTSIARLLAKGLNCKTAITATPCGICENCCEIEKGRFIDLLEIDAASRTKVEDTRDLLDNVQYTPARGRFKIYLIDEIHMLSRHSFNALLKTLEEPPAHVKFLLVTTDPQKLPVTILSRCLQFHLKALDVEQIRTQLEHILDAENIIYEARTLQLLANAADGSLRDALNLTDQALANGNGKLETKCVTTMLGTLSSDQAMSLIEAVIDANGERTLSLVNEAIMCGIDWEALLVKMLTLFHHLAMMQLSPLAIGADMAAGVEERLRKLASTVPPTEVQLYYQILLIGRKELPFAPDRRMGVEMTLLRALAFHPCTPLPAPKAPYQSSPSVTPTEMLTETQKIARHPTPNIPCSDITSLVITSRSQLPCTRRANQLQKNVSAETGTVRLVNTACERLGAVTKQLQSCPTLSTFGQKVLVKNEELPRKLSVITEEIKKVRVVTPTVMKNMLEYERIPELAAKLTAEVIMRDDWAAEVSQLQLPQRVEQVALNSWKEQEGKQICLHLRSNQRHLNSSSVKKVLAEALATLQDISIELTIIEDDNPMMRTPLEWRQVIYEEKLMQAREAIIMDNNIQILRQFFDANLDEESIFPL